VEAVREKLRSAVQTERDRRRVRALDMGDGEGQARGVRDESCAVFWG
jgi:hypothetical protein